MNPWNALVGLLGRILAFFFDLIPNYGVAIVLLTLLISLLLFPLTLKQTRSMKAMQEIQPEVKRIQKEYKGNREEMNKELMALYQERGINPAAGCLPLLVQMPIWFALFSVLRINSAPAAGELISQHIPQGAALYEALEAGNTSFLGMDMLTSPASAFSEGIVSALPYIIAILIVVASSFYQTYQTTKRRTTDQQQQGPAQGMQTAMKIMPLFFGFISWGFPAGLVTYFAVSNMFRVGQQALILRIDEEDDDGSAPASGGSRTRNGPSGSSSGGNGPDTPERPSSGPSPHASKKRKKRRRK